MSKTKKRFSLPNDHPYRNDGRVHVYVDGSCSYADSTGGWGAYLIEGTREKRIRGYKEGTTISEMELLAILRAIQSIRWFQPGGVVVHTDSQYAMDAVTVYGDKWDRDGWVTTLGEPVKHMALIKEIRKLVKKNFVRIRWVAGHSNDPGNDESDRLAGSARQILVCLIRDRDHDPYIPQEE